MNELSERWFIEVTEDNFSIIDKWVYASWGYHPTPPRCVSHNASWSDREFYEEYDYTEITIEQFRKYILKESMKTELLGLPIIKGEKHHLKAISRDLIKLGYKFVQDCDKQGTNIRINKNLQLDIYTKSDGMELWWDSYDDIYTGGDITIPVKTFNLPSQWQESLDFMKKNMDRWKKIQEENKQPEFKVGDYVVILDTGFMFDSSNTRCKDVKQISFMGKHDTIYPSRNIILFTDNSSGQNEYHQERHYRKATPQEIEEYLNKPKIFKMTSSSGDFELEVSKKGIYYRPEQRWLSPNFLWEFTDTNCRLPMGAGTGYLVSVTKVDVGCKKDTLVSQWQKVYSYYRSLQ